MNSPRRNRGLTLVELVGVMVIIAVLAILCMPLLKEGRRMGAEEMERVMRSHLRPSNELLPLPAE